MARRGYNPHRVTMTERLAFSMSGDKKKVRAIRQRNKGCLPYQRQLIITTFGKKAAGQKQRNTVTEFTGDTKNKIQSEE